MAALALPFAPWRRAMLAVSVALGLSGCGAVNTVPTLEERAKSSWSEVQNQYQRRADLIPNLVETVQGYATHERDVLDQVTAHRADATRASSVEATAQADAQMTSLLGRLMVVAEAYPDLKANTNFLELQEQLETVETELQGARRYYNATVRDLNTNVQSFPPVLIARPMGFSEEPFYEDGDASIQTAPKVSFDRSAA